MNIKYAYTILYVKDVEQTLDFYRDAFAFELKMLTPEKDYGELISGSTIIAFANFDLAKSNFKKNIHKSALENEAFGIELAFTTDDFKATLNNAIKYGASLYEEASVKPWGQTVAYVRDINGFLIELCTVIK